MEETSLPIQPLTPVRIPKASDRAESLSSMTPSGSLPTQPTQINGKPKRRGSLTNNNEYQAPLQKKAKLEEETASSAPVPAAGPLPSVLSLSAQTPGPRLLPSPIPRYRQRQRVGSFIQQPPPQRYPPILLAPFPFTHHPHEHNEEVYNELAHWYQQFRPQMWSLVASVMGIRWEQAEEIGWHMGWNEIMRRSSRPSTAH
ncbi:hypothetical protein BDV38DRAFT_287734 [Aspergillus pseudotamarii]|uniref:Uncharacterized protein n=1 Tax=Aspergillus pseudotamarii TaxID=132259 RepID=A0A5N6SEQ5_ASPPS|nr:uncharacterized protein BDV38DRAFT_287734 [Aspergillus pseudotamarii]KAE8132417.1 hypothetical protein BDV38DRAFT_287734 [Aspergillus pseudotamarii]